MKISAGKLYNFNARLGLGPFLGGLPYFRFFEYKLALEMADQLENKKILDIGSGRRGRFPLLLLSLLETAEIHSTDLVDYGAGQVKLAMKLGRADTVGVRFFVERQNAQALTYPDESFDIVFALSTLEHIPDDGDTRAIREIARVLRPGGQAVIAVPVNLRGYEEEYRAVDVSFARRDKPVFYERRYDHEALERRLLRPSGLVVDTLLYYGESGFRFWRSFYCKILPWPVYLQWLTVPFRVLMLLWARAFLSSVDATDAASAEGAVWLARRSNAET